MTEKIASEARKVALPHTEIVATSPDFGAASIEGHYDEAIAAIGVLDEIKKGEQQGIDGYIIACFGDPGLLAARESTDKPVVGIAEAAMHAASFIAEGFSVVTTLARTIPIAQHLVHSYGMEKFCRAIRAANMEVLSLENEADSSYNLLLDECRRAIEEDGVKCIVLGCAGMADLIYKLSSELNIQIIDGVTTATKLLEAFIQLGFKTVKSGGFAFPLPKNYTGIADFLSPQKK